MGEKTLNDCKQFRGILIQMVRRLRQGFERKQGRGTWGLYKLGLSFVGLVPQQIKKLGRMGGSLERVGKTPWSEPRPFRLRGDRRGRRPGGECGVAGNGLLKGVCLAIRTQ